MCLSNLSCRNSPDGTRGCEDSAQPEKIRHGMLGSPVTLFLNYGAIEI